MEKTLFLNERQIRKLVRKRLLRKIILEEVDADGVEPDKKKKVEAE